MVYKECSKILSTIVSTFTSYYVHLWPLFFINMPLSAPMPSFDGRVILYPSRQNIRDYMSWRQADCKPQHDVTTSTSTLNHASGHINNLYNTTFWALVNGGGLNNVRAEEELKVGC